MLSLQAIKSAIPLLFSFIIIGFIAKLGYDNAHLQETNTLLSDSKKTLEDDVRQLNAKNNGLANSVRLLTNLVSKQNQILESESKRRAAAEMKQQRLQDEIKELLKNSPCGIIAIPDAIIDRLREKADSVRSGKSEASANSSKPVN